jgi:hypothetical protein
MSPNHKQQISKSKLKLYPLNILICKLFVICELLMRLGFHKLVLRKTLVEFPPAVGQESRLSGVNCTIGTPKADIVPKGRLWRVLNVEHLYIDINHFNPIFIHLFLFPENGQSV